MVENPLGIAVRLSDRTEKRAVYKDMAAASYPILYGLCADLAQTDPSVMPYSRGWNINIRPDIFNLQLKDDTPAFIAASSIAPYVSSPVLQLNRIEHNFRDDRNTYFNIRARNHDDQNIFSSNVNSLVSRLDEIAEKGSNTNVVRQNYRNQYPEMDIRFNIASGTNAILDGFTSTLLAGSWLSQQPIIGMEYLDTQSRLLTVLRSDAITEFTAHLKTGVLVKLPLLEQIPVRQLLFDPEDGKVKVHEDTLELADLMNQKEAIKQPHSFVCPFVAPLGESRTAVVVDSYAGSLPQDVERRMIRGARTSGIKTAGIAIADFLEKAAA